jgi:hypothetical protein
MLLSADPSLRCEGLVLSQVFFCLRFRRFSVTMEREFSRAFTEILTHDSEDLSTEGLQVDY